MSASQLPLFAVRRSERARRARLTLSETGEPLVVLPARAPQALASELVARHLDWLLRHQRRIAAERRALVSRPRLGDGRSVSLRGVEHEVVVEEQAGRTSSVALVAGSPPALVVRSAQGSAAARAVLERWLRAEARRDVELTVRRRAAEMGVAPSAVALRDQRTRWGSASASGTLSFSWRLVLCPPPVLDYVVVHELAHLRWRGHGPRFWALVRKHAPDADAHRRWLRTNYRALRAALDEEAG